MARAIATHPDDVVKQSVVVASEVERTLRPSFETSIANDRMRSGAWRAAVGIETSPSYGIELPTPPADPMKFLALSGTDPVIWYAFARNYLLLDPSGSWKQDPELVDRINAAEMPRVPQADDLPTREQILEALR